jgi:hypothetical protein
MEWDQQITRDEAASSVLFQKLLRQYRPLYIGSNYDRDQWPDSAAGKLRRALYKLGHPRKWLLRPADLQERFSNLLLVPPQRLDRVMAIGPISLEQPQ